MDKEKIEEMAFSICITQKIRNSCEECGGQKNCNFIHFAKEFYNAGYRKASDVLDEFANRLKQKMYYEFEEIIPSLVSDKIDELAEEMRKGVET